MSKTQRKVANAVTSVWNVTIFLHFHLILNFCGLSVISFDLFVGRFMGDDAAAAAPDLDSVFQYTL